MKDFDDIKMHSTTIKKILQNYLTSSRDFHDQWRIYNELFFEEQFIT
jgi:hypothetical protein